MKPMSFVAEKDEEAYLCRCKQTSNAPFCDGTHNQFTSDQVGHEAPETKKKEKSDKPEAASTQEEPTLEFIHQLAREGLSKLGHHGSMVAMGDRV